MPNEKPNENTGAVTPSPIPPKPKYFSGGLEPGSLRARRQSDYQPAEPEDPVKSLKKMIAGFSVSEFKQWKSDPQNVKRIKELGIPS
jgi:hypothetical protein